MNLIGICLLPFILCSCATVNEQNRYGFVPNQEDNIVWEQESRQNILDSPDGSYRRSDGAVIWSSNPR